MESHHWLFLAIVLAAGYFLGAKWPSLARSIGVNAA